MKTKLVRRMRRPATISRLLATLFATGLLVAPIFPAAVAAQGAEVGDALRLGVAFGGISTFSVNVELVRDTRSLELSLGTWSFRDVSVSAVAKQYFGAGAAQPFVGAGLWVVAAAPGDERVGWAAVLRAPVGVDWEVADDHALGMALNVNRGLWVRRSDPGDTTPLNERLVPLPEIYYRYAR